MDRVHVEDGMGKAYLRNGDKVVEFDLDDPYGRELARELAREHLGLVAVLKSVDTTKASHASSNKKMRGKQLDIVQQELVTESTGESTARKETPGKYELYRNKQTGNLTGVLSTPTHTVKINLGKVDDPDSKISQIKRAVAVMPYYESFSRRQLAGSLSNSMAKRGEVIKFALDYLEHIGMIVKLEQRERSTNGILYKRINEERDAPAAQSVEDGAKAIPR